MEERLAASLAAVRKLKGRLHELLQDTEQGILANALVQHELDQEAGQQASAPAWRAGTALQPSVLKMVFVDHSVHPALRWR